MVQNSFLYQHALKVIRGNKIVDLVFRSMENTITNQAVGSTLGNSYYKMNRFNSCLNDTAKENKKIAPDFRPGDFKGLRTRKSAEVRERITKCQRTGQVRAVNHAGQVAVNGLTYHQGSASVLKWIRSL